MAIAFANLGATSNPDMFPGGSGSSYSNASWTPPTSGLILLFVYAVKVGGSDLPTVSGNSLTWVQMHTRLNGNWRGTLFAANAAGSTTGVTTISFGGATQLRGGGFFAHAAMSLVGGVQAAFKQVVSGVVFATSTPSITLAAASHADNRPFAVFSSGYFVAGQSTTPRPDWTELDDFVTGAGGGLQTQYRGDAFETTASASGPTLTDWECLAVELTEQTAVAAASWGFIPLGAA